MVDGHPTVVPLLCDKHEHLALLMPSGTEAPDVSETPRPAAHLLQADGILPPREKILVGEVDKGHLTVVACLQPQLIQKNNCRAVHLWDRRGGIGLRRALC